MVTAPPMAAVLAEFGREIEILVEAFATLIVICLVPV
jgi:hypothetical protein